MWFKKPFFYYATSFLLCLISIYFVFLLLPYFAPLADFFLTILTPMLTAGILYYLLRPVVRGLERKKIPRSLSIVGLYGCIMVFAALIAVKIYPTLASQMSVFLDEPSKHLEQVKERTVNFIDIFNLDFYTPVELQAFVSSWLEKFYTLFQRNILDILSKTTHVAVIAAFIPFILFYLLKDDEIFYTYFITFIPKKVKKEVEKLLGNLDFTLTTFINGQLFVAFMVGILLFIGFFSIGLSYALVLAVFGMIVNTIPFVGPFIAAVPAILVGWMVNPFMALKVVIVMICTHVVEANFLSPQIIGQRLNIHPLTIVLLLLACGSLYGIIGMLVATPAYALLRVVTTHLYAYWTEERELDA